MIMTSELTKLSQEIRAGNRAAIGRAITLVESKRTDHEDRAQELLSELLPFTGKARRIGITGVPGAGKSTMIEALGKKLTAGGHKVAVLAVDPTSQRTGGSILGDKTRMSSLAADTGAFIRPSPAGATLGGVARRTRETMLICEAAGFDVVIVETVGIGQSETAVASMVDFFAVLMVAGGGDELQGIKRGVLEIADLIVITKADGGNEDAARRAAGEYRAALSILSPANPSWRPEVCAISALEDVGLDTLWQTVGRYYDTMRDEGALEDRRSEQHVSWMWSLLNDQFDAIVRRHEATRGEIASLESLVRKGEITPTAAVRWVFKLLRLDRE